MLGQAFKEWAAVCQALATGRQAIILRKGGVAEAGDTFTPEHSRFWLYPTYLHQNEAALKPEAHDLLRQAERERPGPGNVRLRHNAEAPGAYHVADLDKLLMINHLHVWSEEAVRQRFAYRHPGLYVLPVRVYAAPRNFDLIETPGYVGCKSWVTLEQDLPTEAAAPVVDEAVFHELLRNLDLLLNPTAFV
jgi:hypothetical protein